MKNQKLAYWITAAIMILWFGIGPIFAYDDPDSLAVITRLGYPLYFSPMLTCFKVIGILTLIIPGIPNRIKEWAYAGFCIDLICAIIGFIIVDGLTGEVMLPVTALVILIINYYNFDKLSYPRSQQQMSPQHA